MLQKLFNNEPGGFLKTKFAKTPTTIDELFWGVFDKKDHYFSLDLSDGIEYSRKRYYLKDGQQRLLDFLLADEIFVEEIGIEWARKPIYLSCVPNMHF